MLKIVIFGATSSIAEHCARLWAEQPCHLVLVGRHQEKLTLVADDLRVRSPASTVEIIVADHKTVDDIHYSIDRIWASLASIDVALIAQGLLSDQVQSQTELSECNMSLQVNGVIPVLLCEALAQKMESLNKGSIAVIGSVAGDRGRKSNYIYGAAKGLVDIYIQGMQHRFASSNIHITLIKPGPTDTPMTSHLKEKNAKLAKVTDVAADIVNAIEKKHRVIYTPGKWRLIMTIIRFLPFAIFKKMNI